jgi:hypothetical protein
MNAGKTAAACALVRELTRQGKVVDCVKTTGVSLRRDLLAMEDAGARRTALFTDFGVVATTRPTLPPSRAPPLPGLRSRPGRSRPAGGGAGGRSLGAYGVDAILAAPDLRAAFRAVVLAANDPVAAWGGVTLLSREYGIRPPWSPAPPRTTPWAPTDRAADRGPRRERAPAATGVGGGGADRSRGGGVIPAAVLGGTGYVGGELLRCSGAIPASAWRRWSRAPRRERP